MMDKGETIMPDAKNLEEFISLWSEVFIRSRKG